MPGAIRQGQSWSSERNGVAARLQETSEGVAANWEIGRVFMSQEELRRGEGNGAGQCKRHDIPHHKPVQKHKRSGESCLAVKIIKGGSQQ